MMIAIGFTIPLAASPDQCFNEITPNDMYSSMECAWSGAFIIAGGLSAGSWIFFRALSMNLQICWDIAPGRKFFYAAQLLGWGVPAVLFCITITITGVSFRFGSACHVNHNNSMGDFWGPLLAFAGAAGILQIITFGYCIQVYMKNLWSDQPPTSNSGYGSSNLPSYNGSVRTQTARAVYQRLKKVLWLQWRGICIVTIILVDVIFFSIVFVQLDGMQSSILSHLDKVEPWLVCLAANPYDRDQCLHLVNGWLVNEPTVVAVLLLLSLTGLQAFLFLTRPSIFPAWWNFIRRKGSAQQEFVSLDARQKNLMRSNSKQELLRYQRGHQATNFELQSKPSPVIALDVDSKRVSSTISSPEEVYKSPQSAISHDSPIFDAAFHSSHSRSPQVGRGRVPSEYVGRITPSPASDVKSNPLSAGFTQPYSSHDYFAPSRASLSGERRYNAPNASFSAPKPPPSRENSTRSVSFDVRDAYNRGLSLNPPSEIVESVDELNPNGSGRRQR